MADGKTDYSCKKLHIKLRDLQKKSIVSRSPMSQSYSTAPSDISVRLDQLSTKPSGDASFSNRGRETKPQHYDGNQNADVPTEPCGVYDASSSLTKPSTDSPSSQQSNSNILRYKTVKKIKEINVKVKAANKNKTVRPFSADINTCDISGFCFMPGDELVLCDWANDKIKLLGRSLSVVDSLELHGAPRDVAVIDNSSVIVSLPVKEQFQFIQVLPSLKKGRTIDIGMNCRGVAVAAGKIFFSCYNDDDVGEIRVYNLEGGDLGKRLGINPDGSNMFRWPQYVDVSRSGDKIFVSDYSTDIVSCLTSDGKTLFHYRDDELRGPQGLFVDDNDNVVVCGGYSNTVQVITSAGKKHKKLLSSKDGISGFKCFSFRPSDGTLIFGGYGDYLLVYKVS